ncbi:MULTISPECIES: hypothetical protein [Paenibacillus]|uniref:HEAT repeat domain-containing protein n=1 Tax=Paenibacillus rhizosphaerae TaxID=297318 RepID=A0A839TNT0_9BACL|nr:hypothetical protein [Paenibacillus rhizosphaerae]MBB3127019.1 hypothetical protein [Paenibacillus rhizosphaerae]
MNEKPIYKPLDDLSTEEVNKILRRNQEKELLTLPLSVGQNHPNWKFAQDVCVRLSGHASPIVRANAVLGFAYIARTKGQLEKHIVKPIVLRELRENHEYNWRINDSIDDINLFMKWNIASKSEYSIGSKYIDHDK